MLIIRLCISQFWKITAVGFFWKISSSTLLFTVSFLFLDSVLFAVLKLLSLFNFSLAAGSVGDSSEISVEILFLEVSIISLEFPLLVDYIIHTARNIVIWFFYCITILLSVWYCYCWFVNNCTDWISLIWNGIIWYFKATYFKAT